MDLIVEDGSRVGRQSTSRNRRTSCAGPSPCPGPASTRMRPHSRPKACSWRVTRTRALTAAFARVLAKYVREEKVHHVCEEAVRKLDAPACEEHCKHGPPRGTESPAIYADVVVFDPGTIQDHATFVEPHQYSTGMVHVFVNGEQVLRDGEHTGATPGRAVYGPGWTGGER